MSPHGAKSDQLEDTIQVDRNVFSATSAKNIQKDDVKMETS